MEKQPLLLVFLILSNSFVLTGQPRDPRIVKENASNAFSNKAAKKLLVSYTPPKSANGDINIYAVVVGISNYIAMPRLQYTDDDAQMFFDHLKSKAGGALPASNIRLLLDGKATRQNILLALQQLSARADANDVFIFYFSGHGISGSFLPVDFDGYNQQLPYEEILAILDHSAARQKLCIADACFSGALGASNSVTARGESNTATSCYYDAFADASNGTALLMSSNPGEVSLEDRRLRHGVFTYFLLRGMEGAADLNHNRIVTIQEIFQYTYYKVANYTGGAQTPVLTGDYDNRMPVAMTYSMN